MTMIFTILMASAGSGEACLVDVDCQGGLVCAEKVCTSARLQSAPAPVPQIYIPARAERRYRGGELPPYAHLEARPRMGLIVGGAATLGALWMITWTSTWAGCYQCKDGMVVAGFVPVIGPFIEASMMDNGGAAILVADGLLQAMGVGLVIAGALTHRDVLVYDVGPVHASLAPMIAPRSGGGLSVLGSF